MFYTIYETTNLLDGKKYIGKHATTDPNDDYLGSGIRLNRAIKKYGKENFQKKVLFVLETEEEMTLKEMELVNDEVVADPNYYNIAYGGQGGSIVLKEGHPLRESTVEKIRISHLKKSEFYSELAKENHKQKRIGMYGKKQSDYQKARVRETMTGREKSLETKEKHKNSLQQKFSDPNYVHPNKGREPSAEERKRISEGLKSLPPKTCEHCGKSMLPNNFGKYHGDKCKYKKSST